MNHKILKKILLQKKYGRYKSLFGINILDIIDIGISSFISIINSTINLKEENETIKYFRLENKFYNDYFSEEKNKIILEINEIKGKTDDILKTLALLDSLKIQYKIIYKVNIKNISNENDLFHKLLSNNNIIIYLKLYFDNYEVLEIKKNIDIFKNKEVIIGLDNFKNQDEINHENIFEMINLIKANGGFINIDSIRLESAYKNLYVVGPKELHIDLSEFCNTKCIFCFTNGPGYLNDRSDNENKFKININGNKYLNLFEKIKHSQTEVLALGITGEPFIIPQIKDILNGLLKIDLKVGFLTNGYLLYKYLDNIIQNKNIIHFYINISSGNIDSFNKTRPGDDYTNFLNTWSAINIISQKRPDIIIRCLYVIIPENINGIKDFLDLCIKNNVGEIELKRVVPYEFSEEKFFFNEKHILNIIKIINNYKELFEDKKIKISENFDYIIDDFKKIINGIQAPESDNTNKSKLKPSTNNCYNPYFYISVLRNTGYSCGKFIGKIGKLENFDLYKVLFENKNVKNIFKGSNNLSNFLGIKKWKEKCSRCHHMDVNNMVKNYIKIKKVSINIENENNKIS